MTESLQHGSTSRSRTTPAALLAVSAPATAVIWRNRLKTLVMHGIFLMKRSTTMPSSGDIAFQFMRGAARVSGTLVQATARHPGACVVDVNSIAGIVRANQREETGVRLIVGCRMDLDDGMACWSLSDGPPCSPLCRSGAGKKRGGEGQVNSRLGRIWSPYGREDRSVGPEKRKKAADTNSPATDRLGGGPIWPLTLLGAERPDPAHELRISRPQMCAR